MERYVPSFLISLALNHDADEKLKLCVLYNQGEETVYVVKPTTLFSKIRTAIAKKYGIEEGSFRIDYDGKRCTDDINPKMMEMIAGRSYRLDIHVEQVGGGMVCSLSGAF
jgi:hypothetical protein